jgi:hypothetical protein
VKLSIQFVVVTTALLLGGCSDVVITNYYTLAEAREARRFDRGWLPDILPESSRDIRTSNDLDLNRSEGEFFFDPSDFSAFTARLSRATAPNSTRKSDGSYELFEYFDGKSTWTFKCNASAGHCMYSLR